MNKGAIGKAMLTGGLVLIALNTLVAVPPLFPYVIGTIATNPAFFAGYFGSLLGLYIAGGLLIWMSRQSSFSFRGAIAE